MGLVVRIDHGDGNVQRLGFLGSPVRIGRNPLNEIPIDHPMISQWHAVIRFDETKSEVVLMDLGSTNGTSLNGNRLAARQPVVVSMTDHVFFGPLRVGVMLSDIPPELRQMLSAPAFSLQEIRLLVVSTAPKGIVHIDANTEIELRPEYTEAKETRRGRHR